MKSYPLARATVLSIAIGLSVVGCGGSDEMSQGEIQYLSHLDQSRFFQRQGELKASTLEARSAIELQPQSPEPYLVIIDNLLTAGDALNAERQVNRLAEHLGEDQFDATLKNRINLLRAKAKWMRGQFDQGLTLLDRIAKADEPQQLEAALLKGHILLSSGRLGQAKQAYEHARQIDSGSVAALIGQSRVAYANKNTEQAHAILKDASEIDNTNAELWLWRAQLAHATEQWAVAEDAYVRALEDIGQYDIMTYRKYQTISALARVLRSQGKSAEAFVYEEILAKSAPGTIKSNLAAAQKAYQDGELNTASRYLEEILSQAPNHEQSALMLGMIRFRQGRTEDAEDLLAPLAEAENSEAAAKLLAAAKIQLRHPDEARKILENLSESQTDPEILALVGVASLASGDQTAGESFIKKALEIAPENNALRTRYARYLIQQNRTAEAITEAEQVMKSDPNAVEARILIIQAHIAANDTTSATESANAWVKEQPDSMTALITRGQVAVRQQDLDEAQRYFGDAAKAAPRDPAPLVALGNLAGVRDDDQTARKYFRQAVEMAPDNRQALEGLTNTMSRKEAINFLQTVIEQHPESIGPRLVLLEAALADNRSDDADTLTAQLLEPVSVDQTATATPLVAGIYNAAAQRAVQAGDEDKARQILNRARALFPRNENVALQSAALAFRDKHTNEARDILQEVKLNHPDSARPFLTEADYLSSENRHVEAADLYQLALEKNQDVSNELRYATALQRAGQSAKSIESLERALTAFPDQPQLNLTLAIAYQSNGQSEKARQTYEAVIQAEPNNVVALNNLAWMYQEVKDKRALPVAEKAYALNPDSAAIADTYGWILFNHGHHEQSIGILEKAHSLQPEAQDIASHLAEAYKATGNETKARKVLERM